MARRILIKADSRFPIDRREIRKVIGSILTENNFPSDVEVSVSIVGDRMMKALNRRYRHLDKTTSVLSFSLENGTDRTGLGFAQSPDEVLRLGDLVISYPQAVKEAVEGNILIDEEIEKLIRHGLKNLLGIND